MSYLNSCERAHNRAFFPPKGLGSQLLENTHIPQLTDHSHQLPPSGFCHHMFCGFLGPTRTIFSPRTNQDHLPLLRSITQSYLQGLPSVFREKPTTLSTGPNNGQSSPEHPAFINSANTARAACATHNRERRHSFVNLLKITQPKRSNRDQKGSSGGRG